MQFMKHSQTQTQFTHDRQATSFGRRTVGAQRIRGCLPCCQAEPPRGSDSPGFGALLRGALRAPRPGTLLAPSPPAHRPGGRRGGVLGRGASTCCGRSRRRRRRRRRRSSRFLHAAAGWRSRAATTRAGCCCLPEERVGALRLGAPGSVRAEQHSRARQQPHVVTPGQHHGAGGRRGAVGCTGLPGKGAASVPRRCCLGVAVFAWRRGGPTDL